MSSANDPIRMVDLLTQYQRIKEEIDQAVSDVLNSGQFIQDKHVHDFEKTIANFLNTSHVVTCGNGTDALQIALMSLKLEPGSEVIVPAYTYFATVEVVALLGLTPVIVDVDPEFFTLDPRCVQEAITDNTAAIIPVHLFGQCADLGSLKNIATENGLYIIEDNAQAFGADYIFPDNSQKKAGTIGHLGTTSFYPTKNLGAYGDGGAVFCADPELERRIRLLANHGQTSKYVHELIGINSRLDEMQAAILGVKLNHQHTFNQLRRSVAAIYEKELENLREVKLPSTASYSTHVYHQYVIQVQKGDREGLIKHLTTAGVPSNVYCPIPMHKQQAMQGVSSNAHCPVSEDLAMTCLCLPMHTELTQDEVSFICEQILNYYQ